MYDPDYNNDSYDENQHNLVSTEELLDSIYQPVLEGQGFKVPDIPIIHLAWMILGFFPSMLVAPVNVMGLIEGINQSNVEQIAISAGLTLLGCVIFYTWIKSCRIYAREENAKSQFVTFNDRTAWKRVRDDGNWILTYQINEQDIQLILTTPKVKEVIRSVTVEGGVDLVRSGVISIG